MKLIDKAALVVRVEKLQSEIAEEKKLHEDNSMWYNGINHGFNLTKDILDTLEVKEMDLEDAEKVEPAEIDFEQELYNYFGQVKDFTLGMRIAKRFYDMGRKQQENVSEDLEEEIRKYLLAYKGYPHVMDKTEWDIKKAALHFANWQKEQTITKACDWLKRNADSYTWYNEFEGESGVTEDFVDEFKKEIQ